MQKKNLIKILIEKKNTPPKTKIKTTTKNNHKYSKKGYSFIGNLKLKTRIKYLKKLKKIPKYLKRKLKKKKILKK